MFRRLSLLSRYARGGCVHRDFSTLSPQSTHKLLMVRPDFFTLNEDAASDNHFMHRLEATDSSSSSSSSSRVSLSDAAIREFESFVQKLTSRSVETFVFSNPSEEGTPDAVFPNNWFSTHRSSTNPGGLLILYPMKVPNRRLERKPRIVDFLRNQYESVIDLSDYENEGIYFESTGAMVSDRSNGILYVSLSERAHFEVADKVAKTLQMNNVGGGKRTHCEFFESLDRNGYPIYHTNVIMSVGTYIAVVCTEAIKQDNRLRILDSLKSSGHSLIEISIGQMESFCANILEVRCGKNGDLGLILSERAASSFTGPEMAVLETFYKNNFIIPNLEVIETVGGGGARCMVGELF